MSIHREIWQWRGVCGRKVGPGPHKAETLAEAEELYSFICFPEQPSLLVFPATADPLGRPSRKRPSTPTKRSTRIKKGSKAGRISPKQSSPLPPRPNIEVESPSIAPRQQGKEPPYIRMRETIDLDEMRLRHHIAYLARHGLKDPSILTTDLDEMRLHHQQE